MLKKFLSKFMPAVSKRSDEQTSFENIDEEDIKARIHELEEKEEEQLDRRFQLRGEYDQLVCDAERVDESRLEILRMELGMVFKKYEVVRARLCKIRCMLRILKQMKYVPNKPHPGFDGDFEDIPTMDPQPLPPLSDDLFYVRCKPTDSEATATAESSGGDRSNVEACVEAVVTAARSDESVPALEDFFDHESSSSLILASEAESTDDGDIDDLQNL